MNILAILRAAASPKRGESVWASIKSMRGLPLIIFVLCMANFAAFCVGMLYLGGNAVVHGQITNGHYYFVQRGRLREVSREAYWFSKWHSLSQLLTVPLGLFVEASSRIDRESNK